MGTERRKAGPLFVGGMGVGGLIIAAVFTSLATVGDLPALMVVAYVVAGVSALVLQVAIVAAAVRMGVYHGNLDLDDEPR